MSLFEFLMILLSIIVGLGISELLTGFARILRAGYASDLLLAHWTLFLTMFIVFLQIFWESWSLHILTTWSFPDLLLMLLAPTLFYLVAHMVFPTELPQDLGEYYFSKSRIIYLLLIAGALVGTLFRPLAFGTSIFIVDHLATVPILIILGVVAWSRRSSVHNLLLPLCFAIVVIDTLTISYKIQ